MLALEDIGGQSCEPVAGLANGIYYAPHADFATINDPKKICDPTPANVAATFAELAEISIAHTFKTGKCFFKNEIVTETGSIKSTQIGENGRGLFQNELVVQIAGSAADVLGYCRWLKNQKLVVLSEEFGSGNIRQLGSSRLPCTVKVEHNLEATIEGNNSATITFSDKNFGPAPIYKGVIQLVPEA
ncbi:hypothetical protein RT99_05965 [Flavobacterium sp. MEB061]|uniref:hypothetical protein n=1 Tax=Flavobacterium sp. MEB061 TaxID=1587524 RepID=UPI0005AC471A|nr:hypothetical protein [Flavobacterium sp. MEB061]KIQ22651.1 hypothetical protein RT99_05965 [Flavobacterium sp. MEB061]